LFVYTLTFVRSFCVQAMLNLRRWLVSSEAGCEGGGWLANSSRVAHLHPSLRFFSRPTRGAATCG